MQNKVIYTIGFTKKDAEEFFTILSKNKIKHLVDIRLNNSSQLAAFAKSKDLEYFLKSLIDCSYMYFPEFSPTKELLVDYKNKKITWDKYEEQYKKQLEYIPTKKIVEVIFADNTCLLCSESSAQYCHRRLLAEYLANIDNKLSIRHL